MGYFIFKNTWFLLHGIIRLMGINPWEKFVMEDGTIKLKERFKLLNTTFIKTNFIKLLSVNVKGIHFTVVFKDQIQITL